MTRLSAPLGVKSAIGRVLEGEGGELMDRVPRVYSGLQVMLWCCRTAGGEAKYSALTAGASGKLYDDMPYLVPDVIHGMDRPLAADYAPRMYLSSAIGKSSGVVVQAQHFHPADLLSSYTDRHIDMPYHKLGPAAQMVRKFKVGDIDEKCLAEDMRLPSGLKVDVRNKLHLRAPKPSEEILRALPTWLVYESHPLYEHWEFVNFMNILRTYVDLYRDYILWDDIRFEENGHGRPAAPPLFQFIRRTGGEYRQDDIENMLKMPPPGSLHKQTSMQWVTEAEDAITGEDRVLEVLEMLEAEIEERWGRIVRIIKIWGKWSKTRNAVLSSKNVKFNLAEKRVLLSNRLTDNLNGINVLNSAYPGFISICENEVRETFEEMYEEWLHVQNAYGKVEHDYVRRKMLHWEYKEKLRGLVDTAGSQYKYYHMVNPLFNFDGVLRVFERQLGKGISQHNPWWNWFLECLQAIAKKPVVKKAGGRGRQRRRLTAEDKLEVEKILKRPRGKGVGSYTYKVIWYDAGKCSDKEWLLRTGGAVHGVEVDAGDWVMRVVPGMKESARKELTKAGFVLGNVWKRTRSRAPEARGGQWVKVAWLVRRRV